MENVTIEIDKSDVLEEVKRMTSYAGSKMGDDGKSFERISTTDHDAEMLGQFMTDACEGITEALKRFIISVVNSDDGNFVLGLELSGSYDTNLTDSLTSNLKGYMKNCVVSKWYKLTNKNEAGEYEKEALVQLNEALSKLFYRKKPTRKKPTKK